MTITVPPAQNYPGMLITYPANWMKEPTETPRMIPVEIDWTTMGGDNNSVVINLQNLQINPMSQIVALSIDNSACAANVSFLFSDTSETILIPSYANKVVIPVFTNGVEFFIVSPDARPGDITRFSILNTMPPPIAVPFTVEQLVVTAGNIQADGASDTQLIAPDVSGTLEGISVSYSSPVDNTGTITVSVKDGSGNDLFIGQINAEYGTAYNYPLFSFSGIHVRFLGGLTLHQSGDNVGGVFSANLLYRTP